MSTDRKILILTADAGFGHRSAANAVHEALIETYGKHAQVEIVNPLEDRRTPFFLRESQTDYDIIVRNLPELYRFGYDASDATLPTVIFERALTVLLYEVLHDILKKHQPDAILTTYPLYQVPVQAIFTIQRYSIPFLTAVTDLATVHRIWFHAGVHALLVPNEQVRDLALTYHVPAKKIHITGIPVHPVLAHEQRPKAEIRASLGWQPDLPTLLAVGSRRVGGMPEILNVINHSGTRLQMAVVAGKDEQLFEQLQHTEWHQPVHLFEYADNMPTPDERRRCHHLQSRRADRHRIAGGRAAIDVDRRDPRARNGKCRICHPKRRRRPGANAHGSPGNISALVHG